MVLLSTIIPGASYAAGSFSLPWTALNTAAGTTTTATDSFERLLFALIQIVFVKGQAGTFNQTNLGCEVSSLSESVGVWETSSNVFSDRLLSSALCTFDQGAFLTTLTPSGDTVSNK